MASGILGEALPISGQILWSLWLAPGSFGMWGRDLDDTVFEPKWGATCYWHLGKIPKQKISVERPSSLIPDSLMALLVPFLPLLLLLFSFFNVFIPLAGKCLEMNSPTEPITWNFTLIPHTTLPHAPPSIWTKLQVVSLDPPESSDSLTQDFPQCTNASKALFLLRKKLLPLNVLFAFKSIWIQKYNGIPLKWCLGHETPG